jgi:hypothetical protein
MSSSGVGESKQGDPYWERAIDHHQVLPLGRVLSFDEVQKRMQAAKPGGVLWSLVKWVPHAGKVYECVSGFFGRGGDRKYAAEREAMLFTREQVEMLVRRIGVGWGQEREEVIDRKFIVIGTGEGILPEVFVPGEYLEEGGYSHIYTVHNVATGKPGVFKQAKLEPAKRELAMRAVLNEFQKLEYVHAGGVKEGIQLPPSHFVTMRRDDGVVMYGHISPRYDGDLFNKLGFSDETELQICLSQTFNGLATLHRLHLRHGDIKRENIFELADPEYPRFDLADMGGAVHFAVLQEVFEAQHKIFQETLDLTEYKAKEIFRPVIGTITPEVFPEWLLAAMFESFSAGIGKDIVL